MTDIRQHIPLILSCVRQHLRESLSLEALRQNLGLLLPASYGVGAGCLVNAQGQKSQPQDVVVYDKTLAHIQPDCEPELYDLRTVLVVMQLAHDLNTGELKRCIQCISSAKSLRHYEQKEQRANSQKQHQKESNQREQKRTSSTRSLKHIVPFGLVAFKQLTEAQTPDTETIALALDQQLKAQEEHLRPDWLIAQTHALFYNNPLYSGETFVPTTINIQREPALPKPHPCYVCKKHVTHPHFFYQYLCTPCGDLNYHKRAIPVDLTGRLALITGGRIKIGYATALRLLRAGATVIVTTRFPHDAAQRYSLEPDFSIWQDRLQIYGLDFRYLPVLEHFVAHLYKTYTSIDILINNAAQTIRHPPEYYASLLPLEQNPLSALTPAQQRLVQQTYNTLPSTTPTIQALMTLAEQPDREMTSATVMHTYGAQAVLPSSENAHIPSYTDNEKQPQVRPRNSWTLPFDEIDLTEFLEVQVINVTAPFLLVSRLRALLRNSPFPRRFVVNVSAIEGQFANTKIGTHVHTNMAKASLNMLTHTAAADLARDNILMNSVDPGWISQQSPQTDPQTVERLQRLLPLDLIDAAARVCDPICMGILDETASSGLFYKNYQPTAW